MTDQRPATYEHIQVVQKMLNLAVGELLTRSEDHDQSKLHSPEREMFDEFTERLAGTTYGSPEYKASLDAMKADGGPLNHHYAHNRHHPEHFENGIEGMNLIDLLEMVCDWKAAGMRHGGDLLKSIELNQERFGYSDEVKAILLNTALWLNAEWAKRHPST